MGTRLHSNNGTLPRAYPGHKADGGEMLLISTGTGVVLVDIRYVKTVVLDVLRDVCWVGWWPSRGVLIAAWAARPVLVNTWLWYLVMVELGLVFTRNGRGCRYAFGKEGGGR
jgi:hypothetical protein